MSGRLSLIVHAETSATRGARFADGERLDARGRAAAEAVGGQLSCPARCLVSPAPAAIETADVLGLRPTIDPGLRDLDVGSWRGLSLADVAPETAAAWIVDLAFAGHGGESLDALLARAEAWLGNRLAAAGLTLAVTHAAVVRAVVVAAIGAPPSTFWHIDAAPLTIATLGHDGRRWTLRELRRL